MKLHSLAKIYFHGQKYLQNIFTIKGIFSNSVSVSVFDAKDASSIGAPAFDLYDRVVIPRVKAEVFLYASFQMIYMLRGTTRATFIPTRGP